MKKMLCSIGIVLLFAIAITEVSGDEPTQGNPAATITFLNEAQKFGPIMIVITYSNNKVDTIESTKSFKEGDSQREKITHMQDAVNTQQTQGVAATIPPGSESTIHIHDLVTPTGKRITDVKVLDYTNQRVRVNPQNLDTPDTPKNASIMLSGIGSCEDGLSSLHFEGMDILIDLLTYGKTGYDVVREMAALLQEAATEYGLQVYPVSMGDAAGKLLIVNIPPELSAFTFDPGGDCGMTSQLTVYTGDDFVIPTLTGWGVIVLLAITMGIGVFRIL